MAVINVELLKLGLRIRTAQQSLVKSQQGFARDWEVRLKNKFLRKGLVNSMKRRFSSQRLHQWFVSAV
jgi:hypothetical protein